MTVETMLNEMSYEEFIQWQAFYESNPFDEERSDLNAANIAAMIYNMGRTKGKSLSPKDCVLKFGNTTKTTKQQSQKQQLQVVKQLNSLFGGKDERRHK
jgi:hypothetical protein